ncbi:MAG TPA: DUF1700 domain-containing protein [Clostridia bacterium]|nr:DUF1700 domain-containing protein [Clostridia bacterium]
MTREEFMSALEKKLYFMNKSEREKALDFYHEYIEDAASSGKSWDDIEKSLGTPSDVAAKIKADYRITQVNEKPSLSNSIKLLIAVLGLCSLPITLPIAIILLVAVVVMIVIAFSILVAIISGLIAAVAAIVSLFISAVTTIASSPGLGLGMLGVMLISAGLLILVFYGIIRLTGAILIVVSKLIKRLIESMRKGDK